MQKEVATNALVFLQRATLQGTEVPAFIAVMQALNELANPQEEAPAVLADRRPTVVGADR
jgi:hypothetical protein